jgi:hypothetical protein
MEPWRLHHLHVSWHGSVSLAHSLFACGAQVLSASCHHTTLVHTQPLPPRTTCMRAVQGPSRDTGRRWRLDAHHDGPAAAAAHLWQPHLPIWWCCQPGAAAGRHLQPARQRECVWQSAWRLRDSWRQGWPSLLAWQCLRAATWVSPHARKCVHDSHATSPPTHHPTTPPRHRRLSTRPLACRTVARRP